MRRNLVSYLERGGGHFCKATPRLLCKNRGTSSPSQILVVSLAKIVHPQLIVVIGLSIVYAKSFLPTLYRNYICIQQEIIFKKVQLHCVNVCRQARQRRHCATGSPAQRISDTAPHPASHCCFDFCYFTYLLPLNSLR